MPPSDPMPSCPSELLPQQNIDVCTAAVSATPQVCCAPALMTRNVLPAPCATNLGTSRWVVELSPSCPLELSPQQYAAPAGVTPPRGKPAVTPVKAGVAARRGKPPAASKKPKKKKAY